MRFLKFATVYPAFVPEFLRQNPHWRHLDYEQLKARFTASRYGLADAFERHLKALGHEAQDVFATVAPLQQAWAAENGVRLDSRTWVLDVVLAQIRKYQPSVVYLQDLYYFDRQFRARIRELYRGSIVLLGWRAAPTLDYSELADLDLVLTAVPNFVSALRTAGASAELLPLAFDEAALNAVPGESARDIPFSFIGGIGDPNGSHSLRYEALVRLLEETDIQVWGDEGQKQSWLRRAARRTAFDLCRTSRTLGVPDAILEALAGRVAAWRVPPPRRSLSAQYASRVRPGVFGLANLQLLGRSHVTFNIHTDVAESYAGNIRLFEATGMGACLLTDAKTNLGDYFVVGEEVVAYSGVTDCIRKANWLRDDAAARTRIALAGRARTLRDHTYRNRIVRLVELLEEKFPAAFGAGR